jgi:hypothetical protein
MMCFPLDASMVHTSMLAVATDGESIKFITDCFGGLSVSPRGGQQRCYLRGSDLQRVTVAVGHD